MERGKRKVVIVGAGMAGLTAAAYLARKNMDVLLLEKNDHVGGLVGTFESQGFFFDSGPRAFVNSGIIKPMLKDLGIEWEFLKNRISIGIEDQLLSIRSMDDLQEYQRILFHLYPENKEDIQKIIATISQISAYTRVLYEFDNPNFVDLKRNKAFIFRKLIPWTFKFLYALAKLNQYNQPMEDFLQSLTSNSSLIDILIQHFFRKTPTHFALGYFYVYLDYFYPKGGTGALSRLLEEKVLEWGGKIKLNTHIVEILPAESKVVDSRGNVYPYDDLIWAADLKTMYRSLNPVHLDKETTARIHSESQRKLASRGAESVFILYLGVDRPPAYFQQRGGEHLFYTPSRQGLGTTNQEERICLLQDFEQKSKEEVLAWLEKFLRLNTYEISVPALRDATLAPEGKTGVMVSCLFDYQILKKVESAGWYEEFKETCENLTIRILSESIYPDIAQDILFKFSATPLTIQKIAGSSEGAITGWSFETLPPVVHTLQDIPKSVLTPLPNVYQAGQWAYSPAGVPIAMLTGWYATQSIIKSSRAKKG
ncbi:MULTISPECIES: NAD(P)/FAD-dependent oxidoreductase [Anaerolinea]|uniref:phytoene desaturase family protein n=1 Tax=Anaerolinea TaxID=233189 RepID=UPI0026157C43|nr:NAD(P)/FAD-dependent oxidoreductase [Anaerolinea thermophila]